MPGVTVRTATRSGPVNAQAPGSGRYFIAGQFDRGRTDVAQRVRSLAELEVLYGGRVAYGAGYDDLRTYFEEGGTEAHVIRVVGPAATKGTLMLDDGTAADSVKVDAIAAGAWSTGVTVQVSAGSEGGTVKITVDGPLDDDAEVYDNLATAAAAAAALEASAYVRGTDMGGAIPVVVAAAALSAGADDRASITATHMTNALAKFGPELGTGAVAVPGYASSLVGAALKTHAQDHRRLALLAAAVGANDGAYLAAADALIDDDSEGLGLFGPWVRVPLGGGASKLISPEGYVAACRARAHLEGGPWVAAAGERAQARFVIGLERELTRAQGDALDEGQVSAIRTIAGTTRLYGWRSLSTDADNYALLTGADVLNTVAYDAEALLEPVTWQNIDAKGQAYARVAGRLVGLLDPIRAAGGLYERIEDGQQIDPGYSVDVGPTVNTVAVIQANTIAAVIALRVSPVGTLIDLTIVKAGLTATV